MGISWVFIVIKLSRLYRTGPTIEKECYENDVLKWVVSHSVQIVNFFPFWRNLVIPATEHPQAGALKTF